MNRKPKTSIAITVGTHTLYGQRTAALGASSYKLDLSSVHLGSHAADKQSVSVFGPSDEIISPTAQEASIKGPEARTYSRQLHRNGELFTSDCSAVYQAFCDVGEGLCQKKKKKKG